MSFEVPDFTRSQQRTEDVNILGIENVNSGANSVLNSNDTQSNGADSLQKKKIRTTKITFETFKSKRGLPALFKQLSSFKFQRKNSKSSSSTSRKHQYASPHHLNNLARILEIYQAWGHSLNPQMKFESLIQTLNSSLSDVSSKNYLQDIILNEKQRRRDKIEVKRQQQSADSNVHENNNDEMEEIPIEILNESEQNQDWQQDDELWPEMFGGESTQRPQIAQYQTSQRVHFAESQPHSSAESQKNDTNNEDEFSDDEILDASQVRQMVSFSTMLDTSSQLPNTSVNNTVDSQSFNTDDNMNSTTGGFDDFLSDDDDEENIRNSTQHIVGDSYHSRFQIQAEAESEVEKEDSAKTSKKVVPQILESDNDSDENDQLNFL